MVTGIRSPPFGGLKPNRPALLCNTLAQSQTALYKQEYHICRILSMNPQGLSLPHSSEHRHAQQAQRSHNDARQHHAAHTGQYAFFEAHVQETGRQRARPCAGARQRDPHEQQQRPEKSAARLGFQLFSGSLRSSISGTMETKKTIRMCLNIVAVSFVRMWSALSAGRSLWRSRAARWGSPAPWEVPVGRNGSSRRGRCPAPGSPRRCGRGDPFSRRRG